MHEHGEMVGWYTHAWAAALLAVLAFSYLADRGLSQFLRRGLSQFSPERKWDCPPSDALADAAVLPLERLELSVAGMTCSHCVASATRALRQCQGVVSAEVALKPGTAVVRGSRLDPQQLIAVLAELGYTANVLDRAS
jgi:copper chaperone